MPTLRFARKTIDHAGKGGGGGTVPTEAIAG